MAKAKRSHHSRHASSAPNASSASERFPECLYPGIAAAASAGDWERWLRNATETGDPQFWPKIQQLYQEHPEWRWVILFHLRCYWGEHEAMVAPVLQQALRDPEQCEVAFEALEVFPSLAEEAIAALADPECLRRVSWPALPQALACLKLYPEQAAALLWERLRDPALSRDPDWAAAILALAALFPALTDEVVACLRNREFGRGAGVDPILGCLACQFGLTGGPADQIHTEWGWQNPLLEGVRTELRQRYDLDLDALLADCSRTS
jgi:hypothetical protein